MDSKETSSGCQETRRAYLIRCWQEGIHQRFQAETVDASRERIGFADVDALLAWLRTELERKPAQPLD
jgi:hypothetical protein